MVTHLSRLRIALLGEAWSKCLLARLDLYSTFTSLHSSLIIDEEETNVNVSSSVTGRLVTPDHRRRRRRWRSQLERYLVAFLLGVILFKNLKYVNNRVKCIWCISSHFANAFRVKVTINMWIESQCITLCSRLLHYGILCL